MTGDGILFTIIIWGIVLYTALLFVEMISEWRAARRPDAVVVRTGGYANDMECPSCKEVSLRFTGVGIDQNSHEFTEYTCTECGHYETGDW